MLDFSTKEDDITGPNGELTASEFNNYANELENAVTTSGQALDGTGVDVTQLAKSLTIHTSGADFYTATGTNTYALSTLAGSVDFEAPVAYFEGMRVRTVIDNVNTGASTVNIDGLGAKAVFNVGLALTGGELTDNVELVFDNSNDRFNLVRSGDNGISGGGTVTSVIAGLNINLTGSAANPIVNLDTTVTNITITGSSLNGITLTTGGSAATFLNGAGNYTIPSGGGGGSVNSVGGGTNITISGTASDPVVNLDSAITNTSVNAVTLTTGGSTTAFLNASGTYTVPAGAGVASVSGGTNVNVSGTASDPVLNLDSTVTNITITNSSINAVTPSAAAGATNYLDGTGNYTVPPGAGGATTGSWSPVLATTSGSISATSTGRFVQSDNIVHITVRIALATQSGTGSLSITGLPFTSSSFTGGYVGMQCFQAGSANVPVGGNITGSNITTAQTSFNLLTWSVGTGTQALSNGELSDGAIIYLSGFYFID